MNFQAGLLNLVTVLLIPLGVALFLLCDPDRHPDLWLTVTKRVNAAADALTHPRRHFHR